MNKRNKTRIYRRTLLNWSQRLWKSIQKLNQLAQRRKSHNWHLNRFAQIWRVWSSHQKVNWSRMQALISLSPIKNLQMEAHRKLKPAKPKRKIFQLEKTKRRGFWPTRLSREAWENLLIYQITLLKKNLIVKSTSTILAHPNLANLQSQPLLSKALWLRESRRPKMSLRNRTLNFLWKLWTALLFRLRRDRGQMGKQE